MAFVSSLPSNREDSTVKVDIICVPAVGADPQRTWARKVDGAGHTNRLDYALHEKLGAEAQVHLYDHLTRWERALEIKSSQGPNDKDHQKSTEVFAASEAAVAEYGVVEWADRFLETFREHRRIQRTDQRPLLFICHSTGGIVIKEALSRKHIGDSQDLARICLGITFFSTPHHGSSILSKPEYVQIVRDHLGLKFEMSNALRRDFSLENRDLEILNYKFAVSVVGVKIYSYVETADTQLTVLSRNDQGSESLTTIRQCIVDKRSATISTSEVPIEDEQLIPLNTNHVGAPIFMGEDLLYGCYVQKLIGFVKGFSLEERAAYYALNHEVMTKTQVEVHQFYVVGARGKSGSVKIFTAYPSLETFFEFGPARCMEERVRGADDGEKPASNGSLPPTIESKPATEQAPPTVTITRTDSNKPPSGDTTNETPLPNLSPPVAIPLNGIHSRRPSLIPNSSGLESPNHLVAPKPTKSVKFRDVFTNEVEPPKDIDQLRPPQHVHLFPLPSPSSGIFKWIHVPVTHAGWVPHVLSTISRERDNLDLHSKILKDKIWFSQHNKSRHGAPHSRFVRPSSKCLFPKSATPETSIAGISTPCSATDDFQLVVYLPYLHWDSFTNLQKRASIIQRRKGQAHARPIPKDIANGASLEHKLLWQHLNSSRPVHCRRTLDQYGYPSLRNTAVRDADQILYKRTKVDVDSTRSKETTSKQKHQLKQSSTTRSPGAAVHGNNAAKVLMVDQLWLWVIDDQTVITFFAPKDKENSENVLWKEGDLRNEIYQDVNGDLASPCRDPYDFAALAVFHAVKVLLERTTDRNLQVFRIFEEYISILTEQQNSSFKHFRNHHGFDKAKDIKEQSHIDNRQDLDALLELRDIEDELSTIDKLLKEQQICISDMISQFHELNSKHGKGLHGMQSLHEAQQFLVEHKEHVDNMLKGAVAAQRAFKELLDMKQKQANILEAHWARHQTEVAADQSRSVMIFTIFTIIFLPLSFFASVFGIQSREWSGGNYPHLHTIFTYMGTISLAVIIIALLVAFNRFSRRITRKLWIYTAAPFLTARQRIGVVKRSPAQAPHATNSIAMDLEKQADIEKERAAAIRLTTLSRTYSKLNWEDELRLHRQSVAGL